MRVKRSLAGAFGLGLAVLVLAPVAAWALEAPVIISISPNEIGSNGGQTVIIHGEHFNPRTKVNYAEIPLIVVTTHTLKGETRIISGTEIEFTPPFKEHGKRLVFVCNTELVGAETSELCSSKTLEPERNQMAIWDELYRNEMAVGAGHVPNVGYGEILLNSPQITTQIECVNMGFGAAWNEAPTGKTSPISGHGEILVWWASGHTPKSTHTELSNRCRFIFHGVEENQPTSPISWATAEPPLHNVIQEGIVCTEATERQLSQCPNEAERSHLNIDRETTREGLSLPWYVQFTERSEKPHVRIGLRLICTQEHTELTEGTEPLARCPEASEREASTNPTACGIPPVPARPGCVRVDILSSPLLNVHMEYEGYVEPHVINSGPNGLSPSSWEFEGSEKGEPALHLAETTTTEGSLTGLVKVLGFTGQELITAK